MSRSTPKGAGGADLAVGPDRAVAVVGRHRPRAPGPGVGEAADDPAAAVPGCSWSAACLLSPSGVSAGEDGVGQDDQSSPQVGSLPGGLDLAQGRRLDVEGQRSVPCPPHGLTARPVGMPASSWSRRALWSRRRARRRRCAGSRRPASASVRLIHRPPADVLHLACALIYLKSLMRPTGMTTPQPPQPSGQMVPRPPRTSWSLAGQTS